MISPIIVLLCLVSIDITLEHNSTRARKVLQSKSGKPDLGSGSKYIAKKQSITCYENSDYTGSSVKAIDYIPNLRGYNFNNRISSCCVTSGVWILYSGQDYNSGTSQGNSFYMYGDNYCSRVPNNFINSASSLRYTGAPDGYKFDTLNFYHQINFSGREEYTYQDKSSMVFPDSVNSIVVTGCTPWTLYGNPNYRNPIGCIYPADQTNCFPGMYRNARSLGIRRISSARRGCFSRYRTQMQKEK